MKIIGIVASPHKEGNTAWIVNKIFEGAREQGVEAEAYYFSDLDIKPCQGCLRLPQRGPGLYCQRRHAETLCRDRAGRCHCSRLADLYGANERPGEDIHRQVVRANLSAILPAFQRKNGEKKADPYV